MNLPVTVDAIVLDVEGTTTPIDFVHRVLFGYVRDHLDDFLTRYANDGEVARALSALETEHTGEADPSKPGAGASFILWLMDRDRKSTGLKALQGLIWQQGYRAGSLRSVVYPDLSPALARWRAAGIAIAIYSSGSVAAQRLLFAHSDHGDLTPFIARYFDTTTGAKGDSESYARIAKQLAVAPARIAFVSDISDELDACRAAGLEPVLSLRPGNAPVPPAVAERFPALHSFDELVLRR